MSRAEEFVRLIKTWDVEHLADCLVSAEINKAAKEAIRAELQSRGMNVDEALAGAEVKRDAAISASRLTRPQKVLVWAPAVLIFGAIVIGLYVLS